MAGVDIVVWVSMTSVRTCAEIGLTDCTASVSCFTCSALSSLNAFRMPSGNGPAQVSAQSRSMRASSTSIFSIESISSYALVDDVAGFYVGSGIGTGAAAFGSTIAYTAFGALRYSCL